jgi:hypothetical protein
MDRGESDDYKDRNEGEIGLTSEGDYERDSTRDSESSESTII